MVWGLGKWAGARKSARRWLTKVGGMTNVNRGQESPEKTAIGHWKDEHPSVLLVKAWAKLSPVTHQKIENVPDKLVIWLRTF